MMISWASLNVYCQFLLRKATFLPTVECISNSFLPKKTLISTIRPFFSQTLNNFQVINFFLQENLPRNPFFSSETVRPNDIVTLINDCVDTNDDYCKHDEKWFFSFSLPLPFFSSSTIVFQASTINWICNRKKHDIIMSSKGCLFWILMSLLRIFELFSLDESRLAVHKGQNFSFIPWWFHFEDGFDCFKSL